MGIFRLYSGDDGESHIEGRHGDHELGVVP